MLRKLAVSLAVAGVISATNANALGLGEIKVNSALNEPLKAEIKLLQVRKLSPLQIQPRMANLDEFALAGLNKSGFLSDVSFQVKVNPDGSGIIYLNSDRPVREPFLNFLVEVNWPNGRLVREYTLLLDPPVFDPTPVRQTVQPSTTQRSNATNNTSRPVAASGRTSSGSGASQIKVDRKDTLWALAIEHRPSTRVSVKQMMIALQKKNPDAFIDNNINALRAGAILNIPSVDEIARLSDEAAAQEVVRQTTEWKAAKSTPESSAPMEATAKKPVTGEQPEPTPEEKSQAELKIVTPKETLEPEKDAAVEETTSAPESDADTTDMAEKPQEEVSAEASDDVAQESDSEAQNQGDELQAQNAELEDRLNQSLENVDKLNRENAELNERLDGIQYEIEKLREMLELKDKELSALQNQVAAAEAKPVTPPPPPPEKSFLDTLLQSPAILGGLIAGLIAVLAGLFFFLRRGKNEEETSDDALVQVPEDLESPAVQDEDVTEAVADDIEEVESLEEPPAADLDEANDLDDLDVGADDDLLQDSDLDLGEEDLSDLDDLDLDMDLDLEEDTVDVLDRVEEAEEIDEDELLDNDEFDLGVEDDLEEEPEVADELDAILGEDAAQEDDDLEISDELDSILSAEPETVDSDTENEAVDPGSEIDTELDELAFDIDESTEELTEAVADTVESEEEDDLDFILGQTEAESELGSEETTDESDSLSDDDLDFSELSAPVEEIEDLSDLELAADAAEPVAEPEPSVEADDSLDDLENMLAEADAEPESQMLKLDAVEADTPLEEVDSDPEFDSILSAMDEDLEASLDSPEKAEAQEDVAAFEAEQADGSEPDLDLDLGADFDMADMADMAEADVAEEAPKADAAADDLDSMLDEIGMDLDEVDLAEEPAEAGELESAITHDLDADLDSELDALLNSADNDIELEESSADEEGASMDEDFDELAGLNLLEGADEVETKLDLARAYMDMEDFDGAKDILQEIVAEGSDEQKAEAESLIQAIKES